MGTLEQHSGYSASDFSPNMNIFFPTPSGLQPTWARFFGKEASVGQLAQNMIPGGPNGGIIGTPTIGQNFVTCIGDNIASIILPVAPSNGNSITAMIAAQVPTFGAAPLLAQLLGNATGTGSTFGGVSFKFGPNGLSAYNGNGSNNSFVNASSYAPGYPQNWGVYLLELTMASNSSTPSPLLMQNLSAGTAATSTAGNSNTTLFNSSSANLQLGSFDAAGSSETAPVNIAGAATWNFIPTAADISAAFATFQAMLIANQGISV